MSMRVFVVELCQEPLRYSMNCNNLSVVIGFTSMSKFIIHFLSSFFASFPLETHFV